MNKQPVFISKKIHTKLKLIATKMDKPMYKLVENFIDEFGKKIKINVSALIKKDNKVLVVKRSDYNVWEIPGGEIEFNESPKEALLREVKEETALHIDCKKLVDAISIKFDQKFFEFNERRHILALVYDCEYLRGQIVLDSEHNEYKWLSIEDVKKMGNLAHGMKELFNNI